MKRKFSYEKVEQCMSGRIYINTSDSNIFVRRRGLRSWTMNLGNKWSWVIMCAELLAVVLILSFVI